MKPADRAFVIVRVFVIVAAILVLLIVGTMISVRLQSASPVPAGTPPSSPFGSLEIPQADLDRAQLSSSGDLVTPLNLSSTSSGRTVTLFGAYADSSRTVLFLRAMPDGAVPHALIYDDAGLLSGSTNGARGIIGDSIFNLNMGPHVGSDGMAHLKVAVDSFDSLVPTTPSQPGDWSFAFPLRVPASTHLWLRPPLTSVGSWKLTLETFEVTPSQVHLEAVIDGAAVEDLKQNTFALVGTRGKSLELVSYEASTTVPKSQITSIPPRNAQVNIWWRRPAISDAYCLVVSGKDQGCVDEILGAVNPTSVRKGHSLAPTDYPASTEAIAFDGAFSATVINGNAASCGSGSGGEGTLFGFGMWFQVDEAWYSIVFSTDPRVRQYSGPGTYDIRATISPQGVGPIFDGPVRLTVTSDHYPGPYTGTVRGTLTWTGPATQAYTVNVAGSWRCKPGLELGPG